MCNKDRGYRDNKDREEDDRIRRWLNAVSYKSCENTINFLSTKYNFLR